MNVSFDHITCPVCQGPLHKLETWRGNGMVFQKIIFLCGADYQRRVKESFTEKYMLYGKWSVWEAGTPCSKAQEIALKLMRASPSGRMNNEGPPLLETRIDNGGDDEGCSLGF